MGIRDRVEALERRAASDSSVQVVFILGGLPDDEREPPESEWDRGLEETHNDFRVRIHKLVRASGRTGMFVVGGLPDEGNTCGL